MLWENDFNMTFPNPVYYFFFEYIYLQGGYTSFDYFTIDFYEVNNAFLIILVIWTILRNLVISIIINCLLKLNDYKSPL